MPVTIPPTAAKTFRATFRLQLHKDFTFEDAVRVAGYLEDLGVSHIYLSPILESKAGSNHGYDVADPTQVSAERGGEKGFDKLIARVRKSSVLEGVV